MLSLPGGRRFEGLLEIPVDESDEYVVEAQSSGATRRVVERTSETAVAQPVGGW